MREESAPGIVIRLMENVNNRHFNANSIGFQLSFRHLIRTPLTAYFSLKGYLNIIVNTQNVLVVKAIRYTLHPLL